MKKLILAFTMVVLCVFCFVGCVKECEHTYSDATCTKAPVCTKCGEFKPGAEELGHNWLEATCTTVKTCSVCGETRGTTLRHSWTKATCTEAQVCKNCGTTQGEALGHEWKPATCTDPQICKTCGDTQAIALGHRWQGATCTQPTTCKTCKKTEGQSIGHIYVDNVCTKCNDKLIESYVELERYLNKNFRTLNTAIGDLTYLKINVEVNDPNYWAKQDFEIQIESTLFFDEIDCSLDFALIYADFLPYEQRIQAVVDVFTYQQEIVKIAEDAFPGQKFEVKFYTWGYEYPSIQVGFNSETMMCWRNWESDPYSSSFGYSSTYLIDWQIYTFDGLDCGTYDQQQKVLKDIRKAWPYNDIDNY
jgi:hypothetical protein